MSLKEERDLCSKLTEEDPWTVLNSYFKKDHLKQLVKHQLESYNEFINHQLHKTINMFNPLRVVSEQDYYEDFKKHRLEIHITFQNICRSFFIFFT